MTTVGYGDVFAVTPLGHCVSILNALCGTFIISVLVSSIGKVFELNDKQKLVVNEISINQKA